MPIIFFSCLGFQSLALLEATWEGAPDEIKATIDEFLASKGMAPVNTPAEYMACALAMEIAFPELPDPQAKGRAPKRSRPERFQGQQLKKP